MKFGAKDAKERNKVSTYCKLACLSVNVTFDSLDTGLGSHLVIDIINIVWPYLPYSTRIKLLQFRRFIPYPLMFFPPIVCRAMQLMQVPQNFFRKCQHKSFVP